MWVVWRGAGILVGIIVFACLLLTNLVVDAAMHDSRFYTTHGWPKLLALWTAAALVWVFNNKTLTKEELNTLTLTKMEGQKPGKEFMAAQHSLFFINLKYWPPLLFVLGVIFLFI